MADEELATEASSDFGAPVEVGLQLDQETFRALHPGTSAEWLIGEDAGPRQYRVRLVARRSATSVAELWILRGEPGADGVETVVHLRGEPAERFVGLVRNTAFEPSDGVVRVPAQVDAIVAAAYREDPERVRDLISADAGAGDVIALARRRAVVTRFRQLLEDDDAFDAAMAARTHSSAEGVWQDLFEKNQWLLGLGLAAQMFVAWDSDRLEQVVAGFDVSGPGKRSDGLLTSAGAVGLVSFAEIKHHRTGLLRKDYRSGCWAPTGDLSGAVAQSQGTVQLAVEKIGTSLTGKDAEGYDVPGLQSYLYRPRAFVVAGRLAEFVSDSGGHHVDKIRSFELYRRQLQSPEVLTFDEVLARAEASIEVIEQQGGDPGH